MYSGSDLGDDSLVALKFFRRGSEYEGAVQRERYILEHFTEPQHYNLVTCHAYLTYRGLHCLVMELLDINIRQVSKTITCTTQSIKVGYGGSISASCKTFPNHFLLFLTKHLWLENGNGII